MTDKERILMYIMQRLTHYSTTLKKNDWTSAPFKCGDGYYPHFAPWEKPVIGDLVICDGSRNHPCIVGYVDTIITDHEMIIKEVAGDVKCHVSNESFRKIKGFAKNDVNFLYGEQRKFYHKVIKAFRRGGNSWKYCSEFSIDGTTASITIHEKFNNDGDVTFQMDWNKKTTIKSILKKMIENGYEL